ncbi:MAG: WG repeat-containing protein [Pedobacter sp.]|nr:MAG: WG repeat-containing protein [Pedobacter sp.]
MSHRVYLYNISQPEQAKKKDVLMVEWGYEFPLLLTPLLVNFNQFAGNNYNNDDEESNTGLYFDAKPGLKNIIAFYEFIENNQSDLVDDIDAFRSAKQKLLNYFEKLKQPYFNLDAWDFFNMSDESHEMQAKELAENIQQNNDVFAKAISANDVSLLEIKEFTREATLGFSSFKDLLNYPAFNYGWSHIYEDYEEEEDVEIFEKNGFWGLKSADAKVLVEPFFDGFYTFNYDGLAVVKKDEKFGFVNKEGKIVIPLVYDDTFDFDGDYAVVRIGDKFGLINKQGQICLVPKYDNLEPLYPPNQFYCAALAGKYGVITFGDKPVLPFEFDNQFEEIGGFYFVKETGKGAKLVYSDRFGFLGSFDPKHVNMVDMQVGQSNIFEVKKHKYADVNQLLSADGSVLLAGYERIKEYYDDCLLIRKDKKYGVLRCNGDLILDFEYDNIEELLVQLDVNPSVFYTEVTPDIEYDTYRFLKVTKDYKVGMLFKVSHFWTLTVPLIYDDIKCISNEFVGVKLNDKWGIIDIKGNYKAGIEYEEVINLISYTGIAYGLKDGNVFAIKKDEIVLADKNHLQDYVDANGDYGYYYFDTKTQQKIQAYINAN